ncbi:M42 family metallopeptidase [Acetohalobium arabaticum]|uniref:Peptidase M42 family protein n=1 Tax=Acetohalobium arabaticum (strain ATCC 49924 / DSM 5501 / Z-7288) TaxID=574087 RepID=D9QQL6_ACEAZ|nr:M42 family metallopeptidase [Acetohalobium arabaticum]ADL12807.1 peptidase M42 family protein [Acetohalobium arabaticum DSM 5501]
MLLGKLSEAVGISGAEDEVRDLIKEEVADYVDEVKTDALGNLITYKEGNPSLPTLLVAAHMDEIGLMITNIEKNGLLSFKPVGAVDKRILVSKQVVIGDDKVPGVIGAKAIHLQKPAERRKPLRIKQLYIDIGAKDEQAAKKLVQIGDTATFSTKFSQLNDKTVKGKAFDDRVGCSLLIKLLKQNYNFPVYGIFSVQEEVGLRGAGPAVYDLEPDLALVLEGTTASDVPESKEHAYSTTVGEGPALTIMDATIIPNRSLLQEIITVAEKEEIDYQFRKSTAAGTDAGRVHLSKEGIPTAVISVPVRYIHSPASMLNLDDYQTTHDLVDKFSVKLAQGGISLERDN